MSEPLAPALTFAVRQGGADEAALLRTVMSLALMTHPVEIVVEVTSVDVGTRLDQALAGLGTVPVSWAVPRDGGAGPWWQASAPYLAVVAPGDVLLEEGVVRAISAMDGYADAVAHLSASVMVGQPKPVPAEGLDAIPVGDPAWAQPISASAGGVDGRLLSTLLLLDGVNRIGPVSALVFRVAALDRAALDRLAGPEGWHLTLLLETLVRGPLLYQPVPACGAATPTVETLLGELESAPGRIAAAVASGLISSAADLDTAVRSCRDAGGHLLGKLLAANLGLGGPSSRVAAVGAALDALRAGDTDAPLPMEVRPGPASDEPTGRPVLLLEPGEELDVLDRAQLRRVLEDMGTGDVLVVDTAGGPQPRLRRGPAAEPAHGRRIHSARVRRAGASRDWIPPLEGGHRPSGFRFVIVAPAPYSTTTGGAMAIHRLCDRLIGLGEQAVIFPWYDGEWVVNPQWRNPTSRDLDPDVDVVIYPECFHGNPLGARRVVRWLLLRPGLFTGGATMGEAPGDLLMTYNRMIDPNLPELAVPIIDPTVFFPKDTPGQGKLLWIGKGRIPADLDRTGMTLITRSWPAGRQEMAAVLRAADVLYTCDWCSAVIGEAQFCGTPVVMVGEQAWTRQDVRNVAPGMEGFSFDDGPGLVTARETVPMVYANYLEEVARTDAGISAFVALAERHFTLQGAPVA